MKMNILQDVTHPVENVDELLTNAFGTPIPPKEEILRHKWLESEKAGRDIGLLTALYDWRANHYPSWKLAYMPGEATASESRIASERRASFLFRYVLMPLVALQILASVLEWTTGVDVTNVIPPEWTVPPPAIDYGP